VIERKLQYEAWEQSLRATWAAIIVKRDFRWIRDEAAVAKFVERMNKLAARLKLGRSL